MYWRNSVGPGVIEVSKISKQRFSNLSRRFVERAPLAPGRAGPGKKMAHSIRGRAVA